VSIDWTRLYRGEECVRLPLPTYPFESKRHWVEPVRALEVREPRAARLRELLRDERPERLALVVAYLAREVERILGAEAEPVDPDKGLFDLGLDSLYLIEIAAGLSTELGREVPASAFVEYPSIRAFASYLVAADGCANGPPADAGRISRRAALHANRASEEPIT
jgi:acyl carrier protein